MVSDTEYMQNRPRNEYHMKQKYGSLRNRESEIAVLCEQNPSIMWLKNMSSL